jgi:hypothetical protein
VLVFGWTGIANGLAERFVASFEALSDARKAAVAVRLPVEIFGKTASSNRIGGKA